MLLRPVETDHGVVTRCNEEARRVEPRLSHPILEVVDVDQRLLWVLRERRSIDPQPLLLVLPRLERPDLYAARNHRFWQLAVQRPFHDQQFPLAYHAGSCGERPRGRRVTHRPNSQRGSRFHDQPLQQLSADALPPMIRSDHELSRAPLGPRCQLRVPDQLLVLAHQQMLSRRMGTPQLQQRRLVEGWCLVNRHGLGHQSEHAADLGFTKPSCHGDRQQRRHIPTLACDDPSELLADHRS